MIRLCVVLDSYGFVQDFLPSDGGICPVTTTGGSSTPVTLDFVDSLVSVPTGTDLSAIWMIGFASPIVIYFSAWSINQVVKFFYSK